MKNSLRKIGLLLCLFMTIVVFSKAPDNMPEPFSSTGRDCNCDGVIDEFDDNCISPPPCDKLPIDQNLPLILTAGLLFGSYMIYRYNQKQKNPV